MMVNQQAKLEAVAAYALLATQVLTAKLQTHVQLELTEEFAKMVVMLLEQLENVTALASTVMRDNTVMLSLSAQQMLMDCNVKTANQLD